MFACIMALALKVVPVFVLDLWYDIPLKVSLASARVLAGSVEDR